MPRNIDEIPSRIVPPEEVAKTAGPKRKQLDIEKISQRFIDPETQCPIQVGAAVDFPGFDSEAEAQNWSNYYMPEVYRKLGWGKEVTKGGHTKTPIVKELRKEDGKITLRIIRVTE
jgi:hypothetical protein